MLTPATLSASHIGFGDMSWLTTHELTTQSLTVDYRQRRKVRRFFLACLLSSVRRISNADPSPVSGLEITSHMRKRIDEGYGSMPLPSLNVASQRPLRRWANTPSTSKRACTRDSNDHLAGRLQASQQAPASQSESPMILFSPPYCNAIEYWRRHRLEYMLGGFLAENEICELSHKFIGRTTTGGRRTEPDTFGFRPIDGLLETISKQGRVHKACILAQYFTEMRMRLAEFHACLPKGGLLHYRRRRQSDG